MNFKDFLADLVHAHLLTLLGRYPTAFAVKRTWSGVGNKKGRYQDLQSLKDIARSIYWRFTFFVVQAYS